MFRIIEFSGFESENPVFELISSHNEAISFEFSQFLHSDTIIEFTREKTDWLQVSVKDHHTLVGTFNILFDQFEDNKRKECEVEFTSNRLSRAHLTKDISVFYEGQLILNELQYFQELRQINQEDCAEAKDFRGQFLEIKQKLVNLVADISISQRANPQSQEPTLANMSNLKVEDQLKLTKKGNRHQSLRASFVDNAVKTSMMPVGEEGGKEICDRYSIHPLVVDGGFY